MSWFLREQLDHLLVVLVSIPVCLLFLSILVACGPCLALSGLIVICIYLLLRCLISDMSGDYSFSIDLQDAYLHIPNVKHHHQFL